MQREMDSINRIRAEPSQGGKRPEDMSPQELHAVLWQVLTFRDSGTFLLIGVTYRGATNVMVTISCQEDRKDHW